MKSKLLLLISLFTLASFSQTKLPKEALNIINEGKMLYKSEMASWYGTDIFMEKYTDKKNIGGYFSYIENNVTKCIFYGKSENPKVLGTISFDETYNVNNATTDLTEREFSITEMQLFRLRSAAYNEIIKNPDNFFKFYENTSPNIIPLINGNEKKSLYINWPNK